MTRDLAERLLNELTDLEIRLRVQEERLPDDPEIAALKRDIAERRAVFIDALALLRQVDDDGTVH